MGTENRTYLCKDGSVHRFESSKNDIIRSRFVSREVYADATSIVNYMLKKAAETGSVTVPMSYDMEMDRPRKIYCGQCGNELMDDDINDGDDLVPLVDEEADLDERFLCPICGVAYPTFEDADECCSAEILYNCNVCQDIIPFSDCVFETDSKDPDEWWFVSDWLADKLADKGELVLNNKDGVCAWGRMFAECPIDEEDVISDICYDVQILEGQENYREE